MLGSLHCRPCPHPRPSPRPHHHRRVLYDVSETSHDLFMFLYAYTSLTPEIMKL